MSAFSVCLSEAQKHFYRIQNAHPHIAMTKGTRQRWREIGPFIQTCVTVTDWQRTRDPLIMVSPSTGIHRREYATEVGALRSLSVMDDDVIKIKAGCCLSLTEDSDELTGVPRSLWAKDKYDVGLILNCEPLIVHPKSDFRPKKQQYPLRKEAIDGITPVFDALLKAGVIVPCPDSPVRTPIFPVKKAQIEGKPPAWRFVQDLKAVNAAVYARAPIVPNPHTLLTMVRPDAKFFTVVDLSNAFFSVPVHKDSQFWFAFNFKGSPYTFTRMCQGYCESPSIFNQALKENLDSFELTPGSSLLCYVDDLLICSPTEQQCKHDSVQLLKFLAENGHKASLNKLQFVQPKVTFLGHVLTAAGKALSPARTQAICDMKRPKTKKEMMSFLGMTGYCRSFIPNYVDMERPLSGLIHGHNLSAQGSITWTPEAETAFAEMKLALRSPPTLGLPDPEKPFTQMVAEKGGCMTSVLLQQHGDRQRPVGYFSACLDPVARGLPLCLRAVAAAQKAVLASRDIVGYAPLTLMVPHSVSLILQEAASSHLSAARFLSAHATLLEMPNITVKRCNTLNPATLLPIPDGNEEPHDCEQELQVMCSPRVDLKDTPLLNTDLVLYVDGSSSRDPDTGLSRVGFAVVTDSEIVCSASLPSHYSAQAAELIALTRACKHAENKSVNIYTDSRYAFGIVHDFGTLWKMRGFLKSDGHMIAHHTLVNDLLTAVLLPRAIAVCKCAAHVGKSDTVSRGNSRADAAAKAACHVPYAEHRSHAHTHTAFSLPLSVKAMQTMATTVERRLWAKVGATYTDGIWTGPNHKPCLPKHFFSHFANVTHGRDHVSQGGMMSAMEENWFTKGFSVTAQRHCQTCMICITHNAGRTVSVTAQAAHPPPTRPFEHLMMDFIELSPSTGKKRHCLVIVDMFSKWVEAFPTTKQTAGAVAKVLLQEIIPRWGIPARLSSDNGSHFVNQAIQEISMHLDIDLRTHCAYHPQSAGAVERENSTIKQKLAKCCEDTGLSWPNALPLVLMYMRMRKRARTNLSPYEILFAAPPFVGFGPPAGTTKAPISTDLCNHDMLTYCISLSSALSDIRKQVIAALPRPAQTALHSLVPGDYILIKDFRRKHWNQRRWRGPFQVLLITHTAVKVEERATWVHASHCKKVPFPQERSAPSESNTPTLALDTPPF